MEPQFFRSYYQQPPSSHGRAPTYARKRHTQTAPSPPRKVVSIPVHFVESVKKRSNSAVKIQKTFRGFRVRKTVKKILELKREVNSVEKKLLERETMEVVKKNEKERLKINESLMSLLFKLDSVRGFSEVVRDSRKRVIKKAILLQELIDSVVADSGGDSVIEENSGVFEDDFSKMQVEDLGKVVEKSEIDDETLEKVEDDSMFVEDAAKSGEKSEFGAETLGKVEGDSMSVEVVVKSGEKSETAVNSSEIGAETLERSDGGVCGGVEGGDNVMQVEDSVKMAEESETAKNSKESGDEGVDGGESWECVEGETEEEPKSECVEESDHESRTKAARSNNNAVKEPSNEDWCVVRGGGEEKERKERLLEKMAEDNQRLMAMVADLCQKNVTQTKLICSLSQRVEQLEKAMSERLRKKKKCNVLHN